MSRPALFVAMLALVASASSSSLGAPDVLAATPLPLAAPVSASSSSSPPASRAGSAGRVDRWVRSETALRRAWADPLRTRIDLGADIVLRDCFLGDPIRESPYPLLLDGHGHTIRQSCFEKRVLRQDGTGWLDLRDVALTRGGSDGPGAALTSRGEIVLRDCAVTQNLAEEPGGGVFSMRRVTVRRCAITGNLANDDGGGLYARRGGVQVYDSVISTNLVDGSGGAIGSTGDILVVRSKVDGNTTDGDGGALYADEDGDITVVDSLIDGSDADGPGGAIFTLDGDVAVLDSTLIGNRADDRGGAISGEADVLVVNSTIARNLAVAHAGGGIWARGNLMLLNSTLTNNYAEGEGGGLLAAGRVSLVYSTLTANIAPVGGDLGAAGVLASFGTILGPPVTEGVTGDTIPTRRPCRVYEGVTRGYNFSSDDSCGLAGPTDHLGEDPMLSPLEDDPHGFVLLPRPGSPVRGQIPAHACRPPLPQRIPATQLLERWADWETLVTHDAIGTPRDTGSACDIGAVQSTTVEPAARVPGQVPTGHVGPYRRERPVAVPEAAVAAS
ncbi:MAG TPA: right-handed parallel beta-helix repeat-containing protein, partial [Pedococcus sp.]|nr:right-handed parallel beta-helix repeat-containing protein [Pedococcus sp.]